RKRTRATPEQLSILEKTFSVNPSPNNRVREQLSRELGMSERSIQIWFQNRRAKSRQQQQSNNSWFCPPPPPPPPPPPSSAAFGTPMSFEDEPPNRFSAEALQIGTWRRVSLQPYDLVCHYDTQRRVMVWRIQDGQQRFKLEFGFDAILHLRLQPLQERLGWARLELRHAQPEAIAFYMETGNGTWTQCRDFTQDRQATTVPLHHLDGPALALRAEVQRL
ncbi:Homeodomain-like protein, partial [Dichotomocladium elegans]